MMNSTRVFLTIEQRLHAQLIKHTLLARDDVELVGETKGLIDSLMLIAAKKPDIWIHSWEESPELSATFSHAYSIHPSLAVLRVNPDESAGVMQLQVNSLAQLIQLTNSTRSLVSEPNLAHSLGAPVLK